MSSLKMTSSEFANYLLAKVLPQDANTVRYGYEKSGKYATTYFHAEDVANDRASHGIVFCEEPRFDAERFKVIDNLNQFAFGENDTTDVRVEDIDFVGKTVLINLKMPINDKKRD